MKKIIAFILAWMLLLATAVSAEDARTVSSECDLSDLETPLDAAEVNAAIGQTLDIKAKSAILMEPVTGEILYEANADEPTPPASVTKIMSLLLVMEALERKEFSLETEVTASDYASSMGGSQIWLKPGETMTVNELLKATVIASANDACVALGETVAGSEAGFVAMMNERAEQLGMNNTHFVNCTGLDADGHLTSAHDVAIMSSALIRHELIKTYSTVWMDSLRDGKSELVNTNKLVRFYPGTTGLKTGTTSTAKYCLSATAERDGMQLVAVVMAGETSPDRFNGAKMLLDYGFANYSFMKIDAALKDGTTVKVKKGTVREIPVTADETLSILMPKGGGKEIVRKTELDASVAAPVKKGDRLGSVKVYRNEEPIGEIPILADSNAEKLSFWVTSGWIMKELFTL